MIKKKSNFSIHEIDLLTNIQSIKIMSNFWVMWNCYFFFFYFTYFYTTYITHVNNKYTVIYLQICLEWTLAIATVHQKEHTMYRYYYISSIIAKGFLSATLLNNDPLVPIRNPCLAKIVQVLQAINIMLFLAHTHKLQMIFPVQIINVVT